MNLSLQDWRGVSCARPVCFQGVFTRGGITKGVVMKVKDMRLHLLTDNDLHFMRLLDQENDYVCAISWGRHCNRTKTQAFAIANRLRKRFNDGQGGE